MNTRKNENIRMQQIRKNLRLLNTLQLSIENAENSLEKQEQDAVEELLYDTRRFLKKALDREIQIKKCADIDRRARFWAENPPFSSDSEEEETDEDDDRVW